MRGSGDPCKILKEHLYFLSFRLVFCPCLTCAKNTASCRHDGAPQMFRQLCGALDY